MAAAKKTWQEKLADKKDWPKFLQLEERFPCYHAVHKMGAEIGDEIVLANPSEVIEFMRVPYGKLTTIVEICKSLAKKHQVQGCCSLTTGIFITIAANALAEAEREKRALDIPYWRTLKADGSLNEKYPGGALSQKGRLEKEGLQIVQRGKRYFVVDYQRYL
ncbi:MGMT family protein [candidate division KSB1 bacterium]|nr:MGMT family protein [candidate division KSB1 bacterium]